ncbi:MULTISPECIES: ABC transporter substrate-binding protein [unclassified Micromonospora]|uniref:ABC transporter substrate-binding protein n=1 Tax=unclassified Micromonospora TaxID=2617518 RepID=UPI0022B728C3|nr:MULTISPECIES: ABC transporter substrate-binding protein [unclassified Micromonospora]MCZ7422139.1 ABC transporter substrate-binding protein [Verrucosispora sp. WMMA2121]WBB52479.1 ABC transporter substrate-binding protein [Verrucosispora sp. WMMD573]WBB89876.1 ABC transporter substrate-binding protein [Verrucosispora sp. WMMC514]
MTRFTEHRRYRRGSVRIRLAGAATLAAALLLSACSGSAVSGGNGDSGSAYPDPGITDTEIKIGVTYPFSGPVSAYGDQYKGAEAYVRYVNEVQGGIQSADGKTRKLVVEARDDQYDPGKSLEQVRRLVESDNVFAINGVVGTPPNSAIVEYLNNAEVPHLFAATGATKWGAQPDVWPWTVGFQPAYSLESTALVQHLEQADPDATVAILYQNDDYGKDFLAGFEWAVEQSDSNIKIVAKESYETADASVDSQMARLAASNATVANLITTPKFAAQALVNLAQSSWDPQTTLLPSPSASISATIEPAGFDKAQGVITALYFKDPADPQWEADEGMREYKDILTNYGSVQNLSENMPVHGFMHFYALVEALKLMEEPTRQGLMDAALSMSNIQHPMLIPGSSINTTPDHRFPVESLQLMRFEGEKWVSLGGPLNLQGRTPKLTVEQLSGQ